MHSLHARMMVVVALVVVPAAALACPSCVNTQEENRVAYLVTTAFLSLLPLAMMGGIGFWLWRSARAAARASAGEHTTPLPPP